MKLHYFTQRIPLVVFFVLIWCTSVSASMGNVPQFEPVKITEPVEFHIRYLHRHGNQDNIRPLMNGSILRPGDFYGITFTPFQNCYTYVFQIDIANQIVQLFPNPLKPDKMNPVKRGMTYHIPGENSFVQITSSSAPAHVYFLASPQPNTTLEEHYRAMLIAQERQDSFRAELFSAEIAKRIHSEHLSHIAPIMETDWLDTQPLHIPVLEQDIITFFNVRIPAKSRIEIKGSEVRSDYQAFQRLPKVSLFAIFEEGTDRIMPEALPVLHEYGKALEALVKESAIVVAAHTADTGNETEDLMLSRQQAESIRQFFTSSFHIPESRLPIQAYGSSKPIVSNETAERRRLNHRIEFIRIE